MADLALPDAPGREVRQRGLSVGAEGGPVIVWEVALLPPLVRFFLGLVLILAITGGSVLLVYWLGKGEEQ